MKSTKIDKYNRYLLKHSFKKNGFDVWRFFINSFNSTTGEQCTFFLEYYVVNPALSPKECVLGFKSRVNKSAADLQYALAGTVSVEDVNLEQYVQPSFVMVRAGCLGRGGKVVSSYFPSSEVTFNKKDVIFSAGEGDKVCLITENAIKGNVSVSYSELQEKSELLCNAGSIDWDLRYDRKISFDEVYRNKNINWAPVGTFTVFAGSIHYDGAEYRVLPKSSFGYIDKNWGRDFVSPFFHIHCSNLNSTITGRMLENSCFVVQGEYDECVSILAKIEDRIITFPVDKKKKFSITYNCLEMPEDETGVKLHWTVSVHDKNYVLDIDIFCKAEEMLVRDFESPGGERKVLKILGGRTDTGELRLYKCIRKNLELLEHANVSGAVCEYGNIEIPEK